MGVREGKNSVCGSIRDIRLLLMVEECCQKDCHARVGPHEKRIIVSCKSGSNTLLVKGAVETLLERSSHIQLQDCSVVSLDEKSRKVILASLHGLSTKAPRCLGFAYMEDLAEFATYDGEYHPPHMLLLNPANYVATETDLIFAGLAGLRLCRIIQGKRSLMLWRTA